MVRHRRFALRAALVAAFLLPALAHAETPASLYPTANPNYALAPQTTAAASSSLVVKTAAGNLYGFEATAGATAGYVMIFDATSAPADGAVPATLKKCYVLPANQTLAMSWAGTPPLSFVNGITIVFSSTGCFTKTASATAFISGDAK